MLRLAVLLLCDMSSSLSDDSEDDNDVRGESGRSMRDNGSFAIGAERIKLSSSREDSDTGDNR